MMIFVSLVYFTQTAQYDKKQTIYEMCLFFLSLFKRPPLNDAPLLYHSSFSRASVCGISSSIHRVVFSGDEDY